MNVERLKNKARKLELKDQPVKAIEVYLEIIKGLEGTPELDDELALYNKVGDLYLKVRNVNSAVEMYERAVDRYTESGFPNNAIALCNKILRSAPGRNHVYLKLAQLMLQRGFVAEAKKNLVEYAERMSSAGKLDEAFDALKRFADLSPGNEEIRLMLVEQLKATARDDDAREQIQKLMGGAAADEAKAQEIRERVKAVDPDVTAETPAAKSDDLVFISLDDEPAGAAPSSAQADVDVGDDAVEPVAVESAAPAIPESEAPIEPAPLEIERTSLDSSDAEQVGAAVSPAAGLEPTSEFEEDDEPVETIEVETTEEEATSSVGDLPLIVPDMAADLEAASTGEAGLEVPELDLTGFDNAAAQDGGMDLDLTPVELEPSLNAESVAEVETTPIELESLDDADEADPPADSNDAAEAVEAAVLDLPRQSGGYVAPESATDDAVAGASDPEPGHDAADVPAPVAEVEEEFNEDDDEEDVIGGELELIAVDEPDEATPVITPPSPPPVEEERPPETVESLENLVAENPDDSQVRRRYAEMLLEQGDRERGLTELDQALALFESKGDWQHASSVAEEILRIEPNSVVHHQKQVEYTYRQGDRGRLIQAYMGLADALVRTESLERARTIYDRVVELDPGNGAAQAALDTLVVPSAEPVTEPVRSGDGNGQDFVSLSDLILDEKASSKDTRLRIEEDEPTGDEQRDFDEMLRQFKRGIEENLDEEDTQAHYDLGVAFKEMGLLDEAIAEFQKALRSLETRLQSAEMLGLCFFEKRQYEVAATVLRRAVESDPSGDEEKIGLLYWLGRCEEEKTRIQEALQYYQRVFAVDIHFKDVGERVDSLVRAGG